MRNIVWLSISLLVGLVIGWATVRDEGASENQETSSTRRRVGADASGAWTKEQFLEAALKRDSSADFQSAVDRVLGDLTDAELEAAMDEIVDDPEFLLRQGGFTSSIFEEFIKRDFGNALGWYQKLPAVERKSLGDILAKAWPEARAGEIAEFMFGDPAILHNPQTCSTFAAAALKHASSMGPEAFITLLARLHAGGKEIDSNRSMTFAAGFDFAGLLDSPQFKSLGMEVVAKRAMLEWAATDRETAFQWIRQHRGPQDLMAFMANSSASPNGVPRPDRTWLGGKLDVLSPEDRAVFLESSTKFQINRSSRGVPELLRGMKDPAARAEVVSHFSQPIFTGGVDEVIGLMDAMPDSTEKLHLLETLQPDPEETARKGRKHLTPEEEARLRKKLSAWRADDARADAIIRHLQSP